MTMKTTSFQSLGRTLRAGALVCVQLQISVASLKDAQGNCDHMASSSTTSALAQKAALAVEQELWRMQAMTIWWVVIAADNGSQGLEGFTNVSLIYAWNYLPQSNVH